MNDFIEHPLHFPGLIALNASFNTQPPCLFFRCEGCIKTIHPPGGSKRKPCILQAFFNADAVPLLHITATGTALNGHSGTCAE